MTVFLARACGLAVAVCLLAAATPAAAFSTLEERMSAAQFKAAGLDKLTPEELATLNAWLQGRAGAIGSAPGAAAAASPEDRIGFRDEATGTVQSRLVGTFTGFDGNTTFELENGQVWQQNEVRTMGGISLDRPTVVIEPGLFGSWRIKIGDLRGTTKVKRIK